MPREETIAEQAERLIGGDSDVRGLERGPKTADPTRPRRDKAPETVFLTSHSGRCVLVLKGARIPADLLDAPRTEAVWDDDGGCWVPKPAKPRAKKTSRGMVA